MRGMALSPCMGLSLRLHMQLRVVAMVLGEGAEGLEGLLPLRVVGRVEGEVRDMRHVGLRLGLGSGLGRYAV